MVKHLGHQHPEFPLTQHYLGGDLHPERLQPKCQWSGDIQGIFIMATIQDHSRMLLPHSPTFLEEAWQVKPC